MIYTLEIAPNQWSTMLTSEGVYYAEVPLADSREGCVIKSAGVLVDFMGLTDGNIANGSFTILKVKALDGELIFFAKIRPTVVVTVKVDLEKPKPKILLA